MVSKFSFSLSVNREQGAKLYINKRSEEKYGLKKQIKKLTRHDHCAVRPQ